MTESRPYVWLVRQGRYYVEVGTSLNGMIMRIDNFLEGLSAYLERLVDELSVLEGRQENLRLELQKKEDYTDKIEDLKKKLEQLDKKLGVKV